MREPRREDMGLSLDRPVKLRPHDRQGHRRERNDMRFAGLHARGGNFETGAGAVVDLDKLHNHCPGDFAGPQSSQEQEAQRRRNGTVVVEGLP